MFDLNPFMLISVMILSDLLPIHIDLFPKIRCFLDNKRFIY